jgi:hypothetical protein
MTMSMHSGTRAPSNRAVRSKRTDVRDAHWWASLFRRIWPDRTASELATRTGVSPRAAEYWLSRRSGVSADALAALLRSEEGFEILEALLGDARPAWWRSFKRHVEIAELRRRQEQQRALLERLEREAAE